MMAWLSAISQKDFWAALQLNQRRLMEKIRVQNPVAGLDDGERVRFARAFAKDTPFPSYPRPGAGGHGTGALPFCAPAVRRNTSHSIPCWRPHASQKDFHRSDRFAPCRESGARSGSAFSIRIL